MRLNVFRFRLSVNFSSNERLNPIFMVPYPHRNNQWMKFWMIVSTFVSSVKVDRSWKEEIRWKSIIRKSFVARYDDQHEAPIWSFNVQVKKNDCMHTLIHPHPRASAPRISDLSQSGISPFSASPFFRLALRLACCTHNCRCLMKFTHVNETSSNTRLPPVTSHHVDNLNFHYRGNKCAPASSAAS